MSRLRISYAITLAFVFVVAVGPLSAQNLRDDPRSVAAAWALEADGLTDLGARLMVDTEQGATTEDVRKGRQLSGSERQIRRDFASSRGARIGTLEAHFECPPEPISPAGRRLTMYGGCLLTDGVEAMLQIDPPKATDDGFEIAVTTWIFAPHPLEDVWTLSSIHRVMRLRRGPGGEWTVTPLTQANGHWQEYGERLVGPRLSRL